MTAVIYARYSSDSQREDSIDGQLRECIAFAERQGISVIDAYIDRALSAKTDNRPLPEIRSPSRPGISRKSTSYFGAENTFLLSIRRPISEERMPLYSK